MFTATLRDFLYSHAPIYAYIPPFIASANSTFVIKDEPTLTHHRCPKFTVHIKGHCWCYAFCGLR